MVTNLVIKRAASPTRAAQVREQQTRTLAGLLFSAGTKVVWGIALLTALPEFGINVTPIATMAGLASLAIGFGAQNLVRDIITGFYIILEDQYIVGDTIQVGEMIGRVEHITLRRTVLRDPRGALVTIANGDIRTVSNLSRDWSQAFVDISLAPDVPLEKTLQAAGSRCRGTARRPGVVAGVGGRAAHSGSAELRPDGASTVRLQVRTVPNHQDEISRELRRRIHVEFQRQEIPFLSCSGWSSWARDVYATGKNRQEPTISEENDESDYLRRSKFDAAAVRHAPRAAVAAGTLVVRGAFSS